LSGETRGKTMRLIQGIKPLKMELKSWIKADSRPNFSIPPKKSYVFILIDLSFHLEK
jgi:hypothetical protein